MQVLIGAVLIPAFSPHAAAATEAKFPSTQPTPQAHQFFRSTESLDDVIYQVENGAAAVPRAAASALRWVARMLRQFPDYLADAADSAGDFFEEIPYDFRRYSQRISDLFPRPTIRWPSVNYPIVDYPASIPSPQQISGTNDESSEQRESTVATVPSVNKSDKISDTVVVSRESARNGTLGMKEKSLPSSPPPSTTATPSFMSPPSPPPWSAVESSLRRENSEESDEDEGNLGNNVSFPTLAGLRAYRPLRPQIRPSPADFPTSQFYPSMRTKFRPMADTTTSQHTSTASVVLSSSSEDKEEGGEETESNLMSRHQHNNKQQLGPSQQMLQRSAYLKRVIMM